MLNSTPSNPRELLCHCSAGWVKAGPLPAWHLRASSEELPGPRAAAHPPESEVRQAHQAHVSLQLERRRLGKRSGQGGKPPGEEATEKDPELGVAAAGSKERQAVVGPGVERDGKGTLPGCLQFRFPCRTNCPTSHGTGLELLLVPLLTLDSLLTPPRPPPMTPLQDSGGQLPAG